MALTWLVAGRDADHTACEDWIRPGGVSVGVWGVRHNDIIRAEDHHWGNGVCGTADYGINDSFQPSKIKGLGYHPSESILVTILGNKVQWSVLVLFPGASYLEPTPCFCHSASVSSFKTSLKIFLFFKSFSSVPLP